jgi:molybdopterin-guanine dinucleotide biosynthesis protein B
VPNAQWCPVIGVSGYSDSGKTLLIERLVPRLQARGLRVAVIKHCQHPVEVDRPGKDTDRLFAAGADVLAHGPNETFIRLHAADLSLAECLGCLPPGYDVVLVEGFRDEAIPKIRLDREPDEHLLVRLTDAQRGLEVAEQAVWEYVTRARLAEAGGTGDSV